MQDLEFFKSLRALRPVIGYFKQYNIVGLGQAEPKFAPDPVPYGLGAARTDFLIFSAFDDPEGWVLKPSREGGGNNVWDEEMLRTLTELEGQQKREAFVLMQRLKPPHIQNR